MMHQINFETNNKIARVTINHPAKLNCLDIELLQQLENGLLKIRKDNSANVIVIQGAGGKAFSTGGNLKDFGRLQEFHEVKHWIKYGNEVFNLLESMPMATIAAVRGYAMGGGFELAMCCDLRFAAEGSVFAMPELNHGWVPGWGGLTRLRKLVGEAKAKELIFLGEKIDGETAREIGIVNKIISDAKWENKIQEFAERLSSIEPFVLEMSKNAIMDHGRTNQSNDLLFDALATYYSKI